MKTRHDAYPDSDFPMDSALADMLYITGGWGQGRIDIPAAGSR
jgi:hypothetical protein